MTGAIQRAARATANLLGRQSRLIRGLRPAYESFLDWSSRGQGIRFTINGVEFRRDPRCRDRFPDELVYEARVADLLRNRISPGQLCFDVGANVGYYVLQLAYWSRPGGKVVAFEPNPEARVILEKHVRLNGFADDVKVVPAAVGALAGTATLYIPAENAGLDGVSRLGSPVDVIANSARKVTAQVVTLDEFCEANELYPDWLVMDIEGFELAALSGCRRLLAKQRNKLGIVVELHPDLWHSNEFRDAGQFVDELGLNAIPLTGQKDPLGERGVVHLAWK
jgi:FkbM family methyltransferase